MASYKFSLKVADMFDAIIETGKDVLTDEQIQFLLDRKAKATKSKGDDSKRKAAKAAADAELLKAVMAVMTTEPITLPQLADTLAYDGVLTTEGKALTAQKIRSLLKDVIDGGEVVVSEVKGEKGKVKAFARA